MSQKSLFLHSPHLRQNSSPCRGFLNPSGHSCVSFSFSGIPCRSFGLHGHCTKSSFFFEVRTRGIMTRLTKMRRTKTKSHSNCAAVSTLEFLVLRSCCALSLSAIIRLPAFITHVVRILIHCKTSRIAIKSAICIHNLRILVQFLHILAAPTPLSAQIRAIYRANHCKRMCMR